jgi:hypothetical protein
MVDGFFPVLIGDQSHHSLQSQQQHTHTHNGNINIPSSVNIHSIRVNIFHQTRLDHNRRGRYDQWTLTPFCRPGSYSKRPIVVVVEYQFSKNREDTTDPVKITLISFSLLLQGAFNPLLFHC